MRNGIIIIVILMLLSGFGLTELAAATSDTTGNSTEPIAAVITPTPPPTPTLGGPQPGEAGIGDHYYPELGNEGYDVDHYDLELGVDMETGRLTGTMTMAALATQELSSFNLDFQGFEIEAVTVDGAPADYTRTEHELTVTPAEPLPVQTEFTASVSYSGVPEPVEAYTELPFALGWIHEADTVYVISEPNGAASWYPVNDHPRDKATYTFRVTVPKPYVVAANGLLQDTSEAEETTTYVWEASDPLASYLATVVIGDFAVQEEVASWIPGEPSQVTAAPNETEAEEAVPETFGESATDAPASAEAELVQTEAISLPIRHYYPADWEPTSLAVFTDTAEMLAYFSAVFGPYPFETYGVAVVDTVWPHTLETQTLPVVGGAGLKEGQFDELNAADLLAHQWFGNSVSPGTWQDLWLSEGMATYATWLWVEHSAGVEARDALIRESYRALTVHRPLSLLLELDLPATDETFALAVTELHPPPAAPPSDFLFNGSVSGRGALTLHALRRQLGDELFFETLRTYLDHYKYETASTADFIAVAEEVSGESLADFFEPWLYAPQMPDLPEMELYHTVEATVKIPSLRIRSGPGTAHGASGAVGQDETVHVLGQANRCEWLQIRTSAGVLGWISGAADYVTLGQPCATLAQAEALTLPTPTPAPPPPAAAAPTVAVSAVEQHFDQGVTHYQAEQWDQAIAEFQAAIRLDPEFGPAYLGLGYSYAFGPNELAKAIEALETYLKLVPAAEDRAEVEQDIQLMRDNLAAQEETPFEIPPGMALFVFKNYSGEAWDVDIGPYFMQVPPNPPDREFTYTTLAIEPGTYTWQAHSPGGGYYITDQNGNKAFEFTVAAGEISGTQCCR
jgi:tetratricopeptide (TPR) repeat protein